MTLCCVLESRLRELAKWHSKNWAAEENWNCWIQALKQFKEPLLPKHLFKNSVPMEPLGSLSNHIQAFNLLSRTLSSKIKNKKNHPQNFPSLPGISLSHTCRQRRCHLTGKKAPGKGSGWFVQISTGDPRSEVRSYQVATKRGKNSKRPWAVATLDALCLSGSALSPTSTWQSKEEWKMAQRDWPNLSFISRTNNKIQKAKRWSINTLSLTWPTQSMMKENKASSRSWKGSRLCDSLGWGGGRWVKGVGGGRAELGLESIPNWVHVTTISWGCHF